MCLCFSLVLICFVDGGQLKRVTLASVEVQGQIQREAFSTLLNESWTSRSHDHSFCKDVVLFFI